MNLVKLLEEGNFFEIQRRSGRSKNFGERFNSFLWSIASTLQSENAVAAVQPT